MSDLPECVKRWRDMHPGNGHSTVHRALGANATVAGETAGQCLEWLATAPEPAIVAAATWDVRVLRAYVADYAAGKPVGDSARQEVMDMLSESAAILDHMVLVEWLQDIAHEHPPHGCDCYGCRMPPELRALLKDADG